MGKVTFKTTTTNNDNFQRVVSGLLKQMHSSTNHNLDVIRTDDDTIVIQPMGNWDYCINFNDTPKEETEKERTLCRIYYDYDRVNHYVSLTADQLNLLKWMFKNGVAYDDWNWEEMDELEIEVI